MNSTAPSVLVIDDYQGFAETLAQYFRDEGCTVDILPGKTADQFMDSILAIRGEHPDRRWDAIALDCIFPGNPRGGEQLLEDLLNGGQIDEDVRLIVISNDATAADVVAHFKTIGKLHGQNIPVVPKGNIRQLKDAIHEFVASL
jgi:CheY-like chemotaxis protein